jgi:F420H(2)-dependent quinone reductase
MSYSIQSIENDELPLRRRLLGRLLRNRVGRAAVELLGTKNGLQLDRFAVRYLGVSVFTTAFTAMQELPNLTVLLIHSTGRRTGRQRVTVMPYFCVGGTAYVIGSAAGAAKDPLWVHNLRSNPRAQVTLNRRRFDVEAREVAVGSLERVKVWDTAVAIAPSYAVFQDMTERVLPVIALEAMRGALDRG